MSEKLIVEKKGRLMLMGINRPEKKNAFDTDILESLSGALTELSDDSDLRCGVIHAKGDCFCAGLDLMNVMPRIAQNGFITVSPEGLAEPCDPFRIMGRECSKPLIAAVHGLCFTAGLELALAADICIAASDTVFGQMEVTRGVFPMAGAVFRLPALMGWNEAMRYMLTGDTFTAEVAKRFGLAQEVTEPGQQLEKAIEMGERIAENAPLAVQAVIRISRLVTNTSNDVIDFSREEAMKIVESKDAQEGVLSLAQKRKAVFTGE